MYIIKKTSPALRFDDNTAQASDAFTSEAHAVSFEAPDVICLDHVSRKQPSASIAQVFPTSPLPANKSLIGSFLAKTLIHELRPKHITLDELRGFLSGSSGLTLESVSRALMAYNTRFGGQTHLAGAFLLDDDCTPLGLTIGFDGSKRTAKARFCYNFAGHLEVRLDSRIHQGVSDALTDSWFNKSLSQQQVAKIEALARAVEDDHLFSTLAVPLAFCRYNRLSAMRGEPIDFATAHTFFSSHAAEVTTAYRGGACFTLSELLRDRIRQQTGAEAYVVSRLEYNFVAQWPNPNGQGTEINEHVYDVLGPNTHTDVVVPYLKRGKKCYLHVAVGMGSDFSTPGLCHINHWGDDAESLDVSSMYLARDKLIANPERLAAQGIRCKPKIFMKDTVSRAVFGLDLIQGVMYHNMRPDGAIDGAFDEDEARQHKIAFEDKEQCNKALMDAKMLFNLDGSFVLDVTFLITHREQYLRDVVVPPAATLALCWGLIATTHKLTEERDDLKMRLGDASGNVFEDSGEVALLLLKATEAIKASSATDAAAVYSEVIQALRDDIQILKSIGGNKKAC